MKQRLDAAKFITPTPVQAGAIPPALEGKDVLATAATGTGKTLSFLVPLIHRMETQVPAAGVKKPVRALILLPTRELAMQVIDSYAKIEPAAKKDSVLVVGGLSEGQQLDQLRRGPRLVVATPGRLEDFLKRGEVSLKHVEMLVLDEVDRMLDMGFLPSIRRIVGALPRQRQTMCYSATLDANIEHILADYVKQPVRIKIGTTSKPTDRVTLRAIVVMQDQKQALLDQELNEHEGSFLVFSRTKHGAERISRKLQKQGHDATVIHGDRSQSQRTAALKSFSDGNHRILVATDVAARGIDISHIAHVVNYDLPNASDDFVHRIGRTGRAGATGTATTYVMPQERQEAKKLERELGFAFKWIEADHKALEKEERNKPVDLGNLDLGNIDALLALENRSWKSDGAAAPASNGNGGSGGRRKRPGNRSGNRSGGGRRRR
ncbi:DEAD/DEAH box helicase [Terriglobus albidus]|uniref:DEAD/DEAH box helicase n=1 Tax=Terriglobus albidus TaxID=1592106 RepID=A0A5B9EL05_9BACT|nr:DEAD/DEAH box helicase [Terriglobus albidus]